MASALSGVQLKSMWGAPMWTFSGLLLVAWLRASATREACRKTAWYCIVAGTVMLAIYVGRGCVLPHLRGKASRIHFPGAALARAMESEWSRHSDEPLAVVGGSWWTAANIGLHARQRPLMFDFGDPRYSPWASDDDLRRHGGLLIWEDDKYAYLFEAQRLERFPDAQVLPMLEVAWETRADIPPARFHVLLVAPPAGNGDAPAGTQTTACREAPRD